VSLASDARPPTPPGDAPPGERLGLGGWFRQLGFQGTGTLAPPRLWNRRNVCVVSDERELVSYTPGPRGTGGGVPTTLAAQFSAMQLVAGDAGARVSFLCTSLAPGLAVNLRWRVQPLASTLVAPVDAGLNWHDQRQRGSSVLQSGRLVAVPSAVGPFLVALPGMPWSPEQWVPPGSALVLWDNAVNETFAAAFNVWEPASAPG